jgi:hypothetical protein
MRNRLFLSSLLLCLAVVSDPHPGLAASLDVTIESLEKQGWQQVSPGVMQRTLEGGRIETFGFGAEGLQFKIQEMKERLAVLRKEYARQPSPELRRAIRAHRAEILRTQAGLRKSGAAGEMESASEAVTVSGFDCLAHYDGSVEAFPLSPGVGARAGASFRSDCGQEGEVYAHAQAQATTADNVITNRTQSDAAPNTPRFGSDVTAAASVTANGVKNCHSYAYASVTFYNADPAITYSQSASNTACTGSASVRPFAVDAPSNVALPASPPLDPNGAAMVTILNSSYWHDALLYAHGVSVFDASAGTPRTIVCTEPPGTCDFSGPVPIHASWKPSGGSTSMMSVVDYTNRKVYDLHGVVKNPDGTVKINADGSVSTKWGRATDLDGTGSPGVNGARLSQLFGLTRVFEMERAAGDPTNAIQHALAFVSNYVCTNYRYPAGRSNGYFSGAGCIPMGSRVFLDSGADCSTVSPVGEKAVCYALQKYGAYAVGTTSAAFSVLFEVPTNGQPGGSGPDPYPGVGFTGDYYGMERIPWPRLKVAADCRCSPSDLTATGGRPFAQMAASNVVLPSAPSLDANSAAMAANLNSENWHDALLYAHGVSVFDSGAGTPRTVVCTEPWGTCAVSQQPVPINAGWKPSSGSTAKLSVIDAVNRKVYDLYGVTTNPDGTVKINSDGTVTVKWGGVTDLDGKGSPGVTGADLSYLFGLVRVFEMERAASDPANAIPHALAFVSHYVCTTSRYPATRSDGYFSGAGCIPMGSRIFLDSSADCSTVSPVGEKAICYALQKYGAYAMGTTSSAFSLSFEVPTPGQPGGSGPDPYPGVGFTGDYYGMPNIPWSKLKVAKDCQCTPY